MPHLQSFGVEQDRPKENDGVVDTKWWSVRMIEEHRWRIVHEKKPNQNNGRDATAVWEVEFVIVHMVLLKLPSVLCTPKKQQNMWEEQKNKTPGPLKSHSASRRLTCDPGHECHGVKSWWWWWWWWWQRSKVRLPTRVWSTQHQVRCLKGGVRPVGFRVQGVWVFLSFFLLLIFSFVLFSFSFSCSLYSDFNVSGATFRFFSRICISCRTSIEDWSLLLWWESAANVRWKVQDLLGDGRTDYHRRFGEQLEGPVIPFGTIIEHYPISPGEQSRPQQFGKKDLSGIFFVCAFIARRNGKEVLWSQTLRNWRTWTCQKSILEDSMQKKFWRHKKKEWTFFLPSSRWNSTIVHHEDSLHLHWILMQPFFSFGEDEEVNQRMQLQLLALEGFF